MNIDTHLEYLKVLQHVVQDYTLNDTHRLKAIGKIIDHSLSIIHEAKMERQTIVLKENADD